MTNQPTRRDYMGLMAGIGSLILAGCSDNTNGDGDPGSQQISTVTQANAPEQENSTGSATAEPTNTPVPCQDERPDLAAHDLHVKNYTGDAVRVYVTITPESGGEPVYSEEYIVNPGETEFVINLDIDPGLYEIRAELGDGEDSSSITYDISDLEGRFFEISVDEYDDISITADIGTVVIPDETSNPC